MLISEAFAQAAAPAQSEGSLMSLLPLILIFAVFYLLLIRPQSKRAKEHKQMIEALQRGDEVITSGGELGLILNVSDSYVIVEIAPNVEVTLLKTAVQTLLPKGTLKNITPPKGGKPQKSTKAIKNDDEESKQTAETHDNSINTDSEAAKKNEKID
jgi:preprotein translocase subunit YajC